MEQLAVVVLALFPALSMALIGVISARSWRRSLILLCLCSLWVVLGVVLWGWMLAAILSFLVAASGFAAWMGATLRRLGEATAPVAATSGPPAPSPPATS